MENKGIQTSVQMDNQENNKKDITSQIKGFFSGGEGENGNLSGKLKGLFSKGRQEKKTRNTKKFLITKKNSINTFIFSFLTIVVAIVYGFYVKNAYDMLNSDSKNLIRTEKYGNQLNGDSLNEFASKSDLETINGLFKVKNEVNEKLFKLNEIKESQQRYYNILLKNLYLPSINIWKDPFTENFDAGILGQKFLEENKFQDLYLIDYWSNFVKYVGNDADYNVINNISVGEMEEINNGQYFTVPITISFSSPNKRSFLLLVNKLSMTSNITNISLLNEFFYYLIANIKTYKTKEIEQLMAEYRNIFKDSSGWNGFGDAANVGELTKEQYSEYTDKVIGYHLYQWILGKSENNILIDEQTITEAIRENSLCDDKTTDTECFYNFREKYRNLPYLAYGIGLESQNNRVEGLHEFLSELSSIISISSFDFDKSSNSSFLKSSSEQYQGSLTFLAYGRSIQNNEIEESAKILGDICLGEGEILSPTLALEKVNKYIASLGEEDNPRNTTAMEELESILQEINKEYNGLNNYKKVIKLFEIWRMLNDANLCKS